MSLVKTKEEKQTLSNMIDNIVYQLSLGINSHGMDHEYAKAIVSHNLKQVIDKCREEGFDWIESKDNLNKDEFCNTSYIPSLKVLPEGQSTYSIEEDIKALSILAAKIKGKKRKEAQEMKTKKYDTFNSHRVNNPDSSYDKERAFLDEWEILNNDDGSHSPYLKENSILGYLISDEVNEYLYPSDHDAKVARTLIQWLGTPVGQHFLENVQKRINEKESKDG